MFRFHKSLYISSAVVEGDGRSRGAPVRDVWRNVETDDLPTPLGGDSGAPQADSLEPPLSSGGPGENIERSSGVGEDGGNFEPVGHGGEGETVPDAN